MIKSIKYTATTPVILEAINLYKSGIAIKPICKQLHVDGEPLRRILIEQGLLRTRAEAVRIGKLGNQALSIKDDAFDILTPEPLYWIGFLYADGHIEKEPRCRILFTLNDVDREHLNKFNNFLGGNLSINDVTPADQVKSTKSLRGIKTFDGRYLRIGVSSQKLYAKLKELGFSNRKTYNIIPSDLLKNSRDFWRGTVDGDGWIYKSKVKVLKESSKNWSPHVGLSGTEATINEFSEFLKRSGISTKAPTKKDKRSNVWKVDISGGKLAVQVLNLLYKDSSIYLDRKYQKYLEVTAVPDLF